MVEQPGFFDLDERQRRCQRPETRSSGRRWWSNSSGFGGAGALGPSQGWPAAVRPGADVQGLVLQTLYSTFTG